MTDTIMARCPQCGSNNRVPRERVARGELPTCGKCRQPLPVYLQPVTITDATFASEVERSPIPVVVDVWAAWCGPCRLLAPTVDELASEFAGQIKFAKLNMDENRRTPQRFNVSSIPTLLVFQHGELVDEVVGLLPKPNLAARLQRYAG
jgi:thioredoxin